MKLSKSMVNPTKPVVFFKPKKETPAPRDKKTICPIYIAAIKTGKFQEWKETHVLPNGQKIMATTDNVRARCSPKCSQTFGCNNSVKLCPFPESCSFLCALENGCRIEMVK